MAESVRTSPTNVRRTITSGGNRNVITNSVGNRIVHTDTSKYEESVKGTTKDRYKSRWSYQDRYDYAISQGATPEAAKLYASRTYNVVSDSVWDKIVHGLGGKLSSTASLEVNEARDEDFLSTLLDRNYVENYQSPESQVERDEAAGLNDALTGGSEIGRGDTTDINDEAVNQGGSLADSLNSRDTSQPFKVAESLMAALGGVVNLVNSGVGISSSVLDMDISESQHVFDVLNEVSDIGDFFPMLGLQYDVKDKSFYNAGETIEGIKDSIDPVRIGSMSYSEFARRMRKSSSIKSPRAMHALYSAYRGMASPKAINSYVEKFNENQDLSNKVVDSAVAGFGRYGTMTPTSAGLTNPISLFSDPAFNKPIDQKVLDNYRTVATNIFSTGLELQLSSNQVGISQKSFDKIFAETNKTINEEVLKLVTNLKMDAAKGSMLATYLLVNMMSSSFTDVGKAAYLTSSPEITDVKSGFKALRDMGLMTSDMFGGSILGLLGKIKL